jgi:menaquinone-dependent protoporphyrinogen oxidase
MSTKILVTYATKYGSTQEVAESIAAILKEKYLAVDIIPSHDVKRLDDYQAVVIGTPLYAGAMISDTSKFLTRFQTTLENIPSALFVLGPLDSSPQELQGVQVQLDVNMKKFPWFKPTAVKIFVGALDLKKLRFPDSLIKLYRSSKEKPMLSSDKRDWKAIQAWAASLVDTLKLHPE